MRKIAFCLMATFLSLTFVPLISNATTKSAKTTEVVSTPAQQAEARGLVKRLNEIKMMDTKNMPSPEKKKLRKEVKTIEHRLKELGGYIYISVGAAIIIVLLLIILL